jgi:hypothetical protein
LLEKKRNFVTDEDEGKDTDPEKHKRDVEMKESASAPNNMITGLQFQPYAPQ